MEEVHVTVPLQLCSSIADRETVELHATLCTMKRGEDRGLAILRCIEIKPLKENGHILLKAFHLKNAPTFCFCFHKVRKLISKREASHHNASN